MVFSLLRSSTSLAATLVARFAVFALVVGFCPRQGYAQSWDYVPGASAHPHERAEAPIPTPLRQAFRSCRMWVYEGPDSTGKRLTYQQRFNTHGWLTEDIQYARRMGRLAVRTAEHSYHRHGGRLTKQMQWRLPGQGKAEWKLRTRFYYNPQGQLVRQESVQYKHLVKRGLQRGKGSGGPDLITLGDLERRRRLDQITETRYSYSPQGQVVERQFRLDQADYSRETWAYDSLGRIARHASYDKGTLRGVAHYRYWRVEGGSRYDRTWSTTDTHPGPVLTSPPGETPPHTVSTYCDAQQREIRQVSVGEPGAVPVVVLTRYDARGRVQQVQTQTPTGEPHSTLVYSYP